MSKTKLEGVVKKLNALGIQKKSIASRLRLGEVGDFENETLKLLLNLN